MPQPRPAVGFTMQSVNIQLEEQVWELVDKAQQAGWGEIEAANAIIELAMNRILQHEATDTDKQTIADAVSNWRKSLHSWSGTTHAVLIWPAIRPTKHR